MISPEDIVDYITRGEVATTQACHLYKNFQQLRIIFQSLTLKDFAMKLRFSSHKSKIMNDLHKKILLDTHWNNNLYAIMCYNLYQFVLQTLF